MTLGLKGRSVENLVFIHSLTTDYEMHVAPKVGHSLLAMISCAIYWCSVVCSMLCLNHRYIGDIGTLVRCWSPSLENTERGTQTITAGKFYASSNVWKLNVWGELSSET